MTDLDEHTSVDPQIRKKTLRMFSNGVYIITSGAGERYGGATVTWVSQASFKPPLLMAAIRKESNVFQCMHESKVAAIHLVGWAERCSAAILHTNQSGKRMH